jgi:hypothetical protein
MKYILTILFFVSISASAQKDVKVDSTQLFLKDVGDTISLKSFQQWLYKQPISPAKYDEFTQLYSAYLQEQFQEWLKKQRK